MAVPRGRLHLKDKNLQLMLELTTVASGSTQSCAAVGFCFVLAVFFFPLYLVSIINKCGLDINPARWGQLITAACASSPNDSWAGFLAKVQIIF